MRLTLAFISGFSPAWLIAGFVGAGVVIAIHAVGRRRTPRVLFPAASLLASSEAHAGESHAAAWRRWLLVALRALCVLLIAIAFDRPVWDAGGGGDVGERRVIVVDVSASMGTPAGGVTRAERAADIARGLIASTDPVRTPTALLFAGASTRDAVPGFASNRPALLGALSGMEVTHQAGDLENTVARARGLLNGAGEVHLITDGQHPVPEGAIAHFVETASAAPNVAIAGLRWTPARPVAGDAVTVSCEATLHSETPLRTAVRFALGGVATSVDVALSPCTPTTASATLIMPDGEGEVTLMASSPADSFPDDDSATAALPARDRVLVRTLGDVGPLGLALDPSGVRSRYRVAPATTADELLNADAVLCGTNAPYDTRTLDALAAAHGAGSAVLWIVPAPQEASALERWSSSVSLPVKFDADSASDRMAALRADRTVVPTLAVDALFAGASLDRVTRVASAGVWRSAVVSEDGRPAVLTAERAAALLFDPSGEPFGASPGALVLMHELLATLTSGRADDVALTGFPVEECACVDPVAAGPASQNVDASGAWEATDGRPIGRRIALLALLVLGSEGLLSARRGRGAR